MTEIEKAQALLDSNLSGYLIAKETGVSQAQVSRIRTGLQNLADAKWSTVNVLALYYDEIMILPK